MKDSLRRPYIILLTAAMIFTLVMTFAACDKQDDKTAVVKPTTRPGEDITMTVEGPSELTSGDTVQYTVKVTQCALEEGLIGVDFSLEYNADLLEFESCKYVTLPSESWEGFSREDGEGVRAFNAVDDSDGEVTPVKEEGQFEVEVLFKVKEGTSDKDTLVKLIDVTGAINDSNISMAYGTGNEIKKA